ncbi:hypothetical protein BRADI_1g23030v3 [Brachypodium distachyon]|uniref:Uncharacterized protein n=1 Tax=Brachypodium distachyon TaxID=15368 RepID=A0A0Q3JTS4_BRADI|nr:hypothetical protein BRADI_1g23030v3 [Brachypodium distachyon]
MEGLIPFVIDAIRKSAHGTGGGYRCVSSDGSSHGGGSRRHLMDYWELPAGKASDVGGSGLVQTTNADAGRGEEFALPARPAAATVVAGSAYRRK